MQRFGTILGLAGLVLMLALGAPALAAADLDSETRSALAAALDDEREARATYRAAVETYGGQGPFAHVVEAEARHEAHLLALYEAYRLESPADAWADRTVELPATLEEACASAVEWETDNAAMFDGFLARPELPDDVRSVFERLATVSRERHLPAFQRCASGGGGGGMGMHGGMGRGGGAGMGRHGRHGGQGGGCCRRGDRATPGMGRDGGGGAPGGKRCRRGGGAGEEGKTGCCRRGTAKADVSGGATGVSNPAAEASEAADGPAEGDGRRAGCRCGGGPGGGGGPVAGARQGSGRACAR